MVVQPPISSGSSVADRSLWIFQGAVSHARCTGSPPQPSMVVVYFGVAVCNESLHHMTQFASSCVTVLHFTHTHTHMFAYLNTYAYVHACFEHTHLRIICIHACIRTYWHTHTWGPCMYIYICICIRTFIEVYMYVCTSVCICLCGTYT